LNRSALALFLVLTACNATTDKLGADTSAQGADTSETGGLDYTPADTSDSSDSGSDTDLVPASEGGVRLAYLYVSEESLADETYPTDDQVARLTHINVAFFNVDDGGVGLTHPYEEEAFTAFLDRLREQTNRYGVKMIAAVGGWAFANPTADGFCNYVAASDSATSRVAFADAAKSQLDAMCENDGEPCFDGFDLDLEYIGQSVDSGAACTDGDANATVLQTPDFERARDFRDLLVELDSRFDVLLIAGPGALYSLKFSWSVMQEISEIVDFIDIMAYDYTGPWSQNDTPLDTSKPGCEADTEQCWGCTSTMSPVVDHHNALFGSDGAPGYYNFLCDYSEAIETGVICDAWGSGAIAPGSEASAAVCVNPYVLSASKIVALYTLGIGVDASKLVLGVGFYGRAFRNVEAQGGVDAPAARQGLRQYFDGMCLNENYCWGEDGIPVGSCNTPDGVQACDGGAKYNWLTGFSFDTEQPDPRAVTYAQILEVCPEVSDLSALSDTSGTAVGVVCTTSGWRAYYDDQAEVPWLHHKNDGLVISFDAPRSIAAKGDWALSEGLAGLMFWQLGQDSDDLGLLGAVYDAMVE
jgi:GH18 family chitinase